MFVDELGKASQVFCKAPGVFHGFAGGSGFEALCKVAVDFLGLLYEGVCLFLSRVCRLM